MIGDLTERQRREIAYHKERAELIREHSRRVISYDILHEPHRRWWNHHWSVYSALIDLGVTGKSVLIPGCGEGTDAIRLSRLGAEVCAFDLSQEMLTIAVEHKVRESVTADFRCMPAERLDYPDDRFDVIFARDVLHHCDLARCLPEFIRVVKPGGFFVFDELYTHHLLQRIRESKIGCAARTTLVPVIYPTAAVDVYVTEDERKLSDFDLAAIVNVLSEVKCSYFSMAVERVLPNWDIAAKLDRIFLKLLGPVGSLLAGRFIVIGRVRK